MITAGPSCSAGVTVCQCTADCPGYNTVRGHHHSNTVTMLEMNIETLLQAAEYIERRERGKRVVVRAEVRPLCLFNYRVAVLQSCELNMADSSLSVKTLRLTVPPG